MSQARVLTRPLGGSSLANVAARGEESEFVPRRPRDVAGWRARVEEVRDASPTDWWSALAPAIGSESAVAKRLERVARGRGVLVTTGQQPGFFGGPIYAWSKAITALALADALEDVTGVPASPLFWAATDDADYAEASVTYVATRAGLRELRMPAAAREGESMAQQPLGDVRAQIDELAAAAGSAAFDDPLAAVRTAYTQSATVGDAYLSLMRRMLEPLGIPVLDASHTSVMRASQPLLQRALRSARDIDAGLVERDAALRAAGHQPQVRHVPGLSLVFEYVNGAKQRVPLSRATAVARTRDAVLGPNVLLRPMLERALLPTVAYAAGPGELAYFAQVSALVPTLGVPEPLAVPRWSGIIVEPYVERILERLNLTIDEVADRDAALERLVAQRIPRSVARSISETRDTVHRAIDAMRNAFAEDERPLVERRVVDGAEGQLMHRLDRLERRVLAAAKRREAELVERVDAVHAALHPLSRPQERVLNLIPILAREGPPLLEAMRKAAATHAASLVQPTGTVADGSGHRSAPITT